MTPADLDRLEDQERLAMLIDHKAWEFRDRPSDPGYYGEDEWNAALSKADDIIRSGWASPTRIRTLEGALDKAEVALAPFVQTYREFLKPNPFADQSSSTFKEFQAADEALTALRAAREPLSHPSTEGEG